MQSCKLNSKAHGGTTLIALLDKTRCGAIQLDSSGRIVAANVRAGAPGLSPAEARLTAMLAKEHKLREIEALNGPS